MRISYLLLFFIILVSCKKMGTAHDERTSSEKAILHLYDKAKDMAYSPMERKEYLHKALRIHTKNDSLEVVMRYSKCYLHFSLKEYDSLFYEGKKLTESATASTDFLSLGKYYHLMAYYYENVAHHMDSAYYYNNVSKNYYLQVRDSGRALKRLLRQAVLQNISNDFFGAKETLTEALRYPKNSITNKDLGVIYGELAANNNKLSNHKDAISYYKFAIATTNDSVDILAYKNNLASTLINQGRYASAISLLKPLLADTLVEKKTAFYARVLDNLAFAEWKNGKKQQRPKLFEALKIRKEKNDKRGQIASYSHLGKYHSKDYPKQAEKYFDTVIHLSRQLKIPKAEQDALKNLMHLQPNNVKIRNRYVFLQDSLYQVGLKVKTQFAKMKYDDEQKQLSILRLEAEQERKNTDLAREQLQKILLLALSVILLLIGTFLVFFLKQRHKKEKLQEVYATEKRISKKVHDELANDIYGIMTLMEHKKPFPKEAALQGLDDIYKRTRNISHATGHIETENFLEELRNLLSQFRSDDMTMAVLGMDQVKWGSMPSETKITLYRVLNELMVNMKKHSGATAVSLRFQQLGNNLNFWYTDNGRGVQLPLNRGEGISNTETRTKNHGGTISFDSAPNKGFKVQCTLPI